MSSKESELKPALVTCNFLVTTMELHRPAPRPDGALPHGHGGSSGWGFAEKVGVASFIGGNETGAKLIETSSLNRIACLSHQLEIEM